jgi:hypothetical protein
MRIERKFSRGINVIWVVQSPLQKYFRSLLTQITCISLAIPAQYRGAFRDRHERKVGMRWTRAALLTRAPARGRRSRVVLTPRRRRQVGERDFTDDGDKKARSPGRARNRLLKPSRAGMPGDPGATVVTNARAYHSTRAAAGATGTRHSPLLPWGSATPSLGGLFHAQLERGARRGCGSVFGISATSLRAQRSNPSCRKPGMDCFVASLFLTLPLRGPRRA